MDTDHGGVVDRSGARSAIASGSRASGRTVSRPRFWRGGPAVVALLALAKIFVHLTSNGAFGGFGWEYFVDELYYLDCARHLAWGYADLPPLMPAVTALAVALFGSTPFATRLAVTLAGGLLVLVAGLMAKDMGGARFAQVLAALATLSAPVLLAASSFNSMNGFEPLWWAGCAWILIRIANGGSPRWWLVFGLLAGLSLLTKHTALLYGVAALAGLLATAERRALRQGWFWLASAVALGLFAPNLIWMIRHGFPHLEVLANVRADGRDISLSAWTFLWQQVSMVGPAGAALAAIGVVATIGQERCKPYRQLGVAFVVVVGALAVLGGRVYYTLSAWVPMLCAGAVGLESWLGKSRRGSRTIRAATLAATALGGLVLAPAMMPVLRPEAQASYLRRTGLVPPQLEQHAQSALPQLLADRLAWRPIADAVARVVAALPPEEAARVAVFGQGYGEAGAVNAYARELDLPPAVSGHLSYWYWGYAPYRGDEVWVVVGDDDRLVDLFDSVELGAVVDQPALAMPRWTLPIWVCRGLRVPLEQLWPETRNFH